ncbi:MAG: response regulator [Gammaproteobacteria bacterium]|nr:response regulator [Gammaproteobacteria bacterium]
MDSNSNYSHTIFVVEDNPVNAELLVGILQVDGHQARVFDQGGQVVAEAIAHPPSMFLLDVRMSGIDGLSLCRLIKQQPSLATIPVIFITALDDEASIEEGFRNGAVDYIQKPVRVSETLARIRVHLQLYEANRRILRDSSERALMDIELRQALLNTLTIARNEYKYVADVETDLQSLPFVMCHEGTLNQAFLNISIRHI